MGRRHLLVLSCGLAVACGSNEPAAQDSSASTGGKGDVVVDAATCEQHFEAYTPCPQIDSDSATLPELEASIACQEELLTDPVWACCELDSLADGEFCSARVEEGRNLMCDMAHDDYNECALEQGFQLGACRNAFLVWDEDWDCCRRLDSGLCGGAQPAPIPDIEALTERIIAADGYIHLDSLFDQLHPVDVLPQALEDSIPLYDTPIANNMLAVRELNIDLSDPDWREKLEATETPLVIHDVVERLPISYAVTGFGEAIKERILEADAYISFWRTAEGRTVLATHWYNKHKVGIAGGVGWDHGPTFIPTLSACERLSPAQLAAPTYPELMYALDDANGLVGDSCVGGAFGSLDPASLGALQSHLSARYRATVGDDSRINTIEAAYAISTAGFAGTLVEMVEVPSQQTIDLIGDDFPVRRARLLVNERWEVVGKWDDDNCEGEIGYPDRPECEWRELLP